MEKWLRFFDRPSLTNLTHKKSLSPRLKKVPRRSSSFSSARKEMVNDIDYHSRFLRQGVWLTETEVKNIAVTRDVTERHSKRLKRTSQRVPRRDVTGASRNVKKASRNVTKASRNVTGASRRVTKRHSWRHMDVTKDVQCDVTPRIYINERLRQKLTKNKKIPFAEYHLLSRQSFSPRVK